MRDDGDFERAWLAKLSAGLLRVAGEHTHSAVMRGSEGLSSRSDRHEVIAWSREAMERLDSLVDEKGRKEILSGCACRYPSSDLDEIRKSYQEARDIDRAIRMLQERFEAFLRDDLRLHEDLVMEIVARGWGLAGVRQGNTIVATKIPKSGNLEEYMRETDPARKRQLYCHCPRVRDAVGTPETMPLTYCHCGAGFYKGIWEEILQRPVEVELLTTVLRGDDLCRIAIRLPAD